MIKPVSLIILLTCLSVMQSLLAARPVAGKDYHECVLINVEKACTFEAIETIKSSCAAIHSDNTAENTASRQSDSLPGDNILALYIGYDGDALEMRLKNTSEKLTITRMTIVFLHDDSRTDSDTFIQTIGPRPYGNLGATFTLAETLAPGKEQVFFLDASNLNRNHAYNWQVTDVVAFEQ